MADIHGRLDLLDQVVQAIDEDLHRYPVRQHRLVFLGDYVDRGPNSAGVLDRLIDLGRLYPTICLKGNHEALMLEALINAWSFDSWAGVGGLKTLESYGVKPAGSRDPDAALALSMTFAERLPATHLAFLQSLALSFEIDDYFFVHAGVRPEVPLDAQEEEDLLWIRDEFLDFSGPFEKFIVHGHTPMRAPEIRANRINLDTGAYATSRLTCMAFEEDRRYFVT